MKKGYSITEIFSEVAAAMSNATGITLNYQYGYVRELNAKLQQASEAWGENSGNYPLLWLAQPFVEERGRSNGYYSDAEGLRLFLIVGSSPEYTAEQRQSETFPILNTLYEALMDAMAENPAIETTGDIPRHRIVDRYYWGEDQKQVLNDVVDVKEISGLNFKINFFKLCLPFKP